MNALIIIFTTIIIPYSRGLPTVTFTEEPVDHIIPWKGHIELGCRVNYSAAVYSWLAVRYAPIDLHYANGFLVPVRSTKDSVEPETEVIESQWCHPHAEGRLTIVYPGSPDLPQSMLPRKPVDATSLVNRAPWLEGAYRCKVTIPGYGTLLSRWAQVRLSDLFLEPGAATASSPMVNSNPDFPPSLTDGIPRLGGGSYWPGEVVILRCPAKAISAQAPIYRWYFASTDGSLMQPVGLSATSGIRAQAKPVEFEAIPLDNGRWLQVRLGRLDNSTTGFTQATNRRRRALQTGARYSNAALAAAGFGEYFCKVDIPRTWVTPNFPEGSQLNLTGPYIPVYLASGAQRPGPTSEIVDVQPFWVVTPDVLARVELPTPPTVYTSQIGEDGSVIHNRSDTVEFWRPIGSSVTLLCAANLRGRSSGLSELSWSFGQIYAKQTVSDRAGTDDLGRHSNGYRLEWLKDGVPVRMDMDDRRITLMSAGHLRIDRLEIGDAGVYVCHVIQSNLKKVLLQASIALFIGQAPTPVGPVVNTVNGHIQAEKNMTCTFVAQPNAQFSWIKNGEPVKHSQYFRIGRITTIKSRDALDQLNHDSNRSTWSTQGTELSIRGLLPNDEGYFQCFAMNRFGSAQATYTLRVQTAFLTGYQGSNGNDQFTLLPAPSHAVVQALSDTQAYITWTPPDPSFRTDSQDPIGYLIRLRTPASPQGLTLNTTKPALLLTDLREDSPYHVEVFTVRLSDGRQSPDSATIRFRTKPLLHRPAAVTNLAADAGEFRTLILSWRPAPKPTHLMRPTEEISHYRITMFNLKPNALPNRDETQAKPLLMTLAVSQLQRSADRFTHVVSNLTPDTFYQVSVQAVTVNNITGYPAVLSSSARVASRPPSKPPTQVRVRSIGAHVATVTWEPPPEGSRNGELILYRINISCEDWLRPRQITAVNAMSQLIRGLSRSTKYELTVSAATRGGNGPDSALVAFSTLADENSADRDAAQTNEGYVLRGDEGLSAYDATHPKTPLTNLKKTSQLRTVENLRTIEDERSLLILWSPPASGRLRDGQNPPELDRYVIKWGQLYPGPQSATVAVNQTRFLIDNLEANTPYMIEVSAINKKGEATSAMINGRTKPVQFRHRILIPLNLQVTSVDPDGAVVMWDEPRCSVQSTDAKNSAECLSKELIKYYQVAYRVIGRRKDQASSLDSSDENEKQDEPETEASETDAQLDSSTHLLNVSRTVVRLDQLHAGRRYSVMVRAMGSAPASAGTQSDVLTSEWSMEQVFETPEQKPGDAPNDVSLTALPFPPGDGPVSVQVSWQPPLRPHGRLVGYILYYTADRHLPLVRWSKRHLPADSLNTVLSGLSRGLIYFVQLRARNEHGNGPLSPIRLYRTPDVFGQGGGRIPLGRTYHNATSIPSEFLTFGQTMLDRANQDSMEHGEKQSSDTMTTNRSNNTSMMVIGSVIGLGLMVLTVLLALFWWRRQRRPFVPVLGYKPPGSHGDGLQNSDGLRSLSKTGSIGSHGTKRIRGAYPNQDIALLMSNGEALSGADPCSPQTISNQPHSALLGRQAPNEQLTTSLQLSTGAGRPVNATTASHAALLQHQLQQHNRTPSWDRDSDSLQFASVSQQRQADGAVAPGLFDLHPSNNTPTRTGSASTNSGPGSVCTPTRITGNPTYQAHGNTLFPVETSMAYSYASSSLGATPGTAPLVLPRSPMNQYQLGTSPGYMGGLVNGAAAAVSSSGGLLVPSYYPAAMAYPGSQPMHASAGPGQPVFYPAPGPSAVVGAQTLAYPVINAHYLTSNPVTANAPRVNAADLMSFTSSDDIRPVMSTSIHNEGSSLDEASSVNQPTTTASKYATQSANDMQMATTYPNPRTPSRKAERPGTGSVTSPSRKSSSHTVTTVSNPSGIRSPKRRPPQNAKSNQYRTPGESPLTQNGKKVDAQSEGVNGDGADDGMNKAFSTEELSQEMANLEGLMKDLSAITREEFNC